MNSIIFLAGAVIIAIGLFLAFRNRRRPKGPTKVIEVYKGEGVPFQ